jgi:hypothetical protein
MNNGTQSLGLVHPCNPLEMSLLDMGSISSISPLCTVPLLLLLMQVLPPSCTCTLTCNLAVMLQIVSWNP